VSAGDSGEEMDMPCGQPTEGETGGISESRGKQLTSADKKGKDNPTDMQAIMSCIKDMFREIRENRKESEKSAKELEENMTKGREERNKRIKMFRKIREENRKESDKRAKEYNKRLESISVVHKREMLSSMNQVASDVEQRTDRKSEAVNKEISQITEYQRTVSSTDRESTE
jgi:hypothetical protein